MVRIYELRKIVRGNGTDNYYVDLKDLEKLIQKVQKQYFFAKCPLCMKSGSDCYYCNGAGQVQCIKKSVFEKFFNIDEIIKF